MSKNVSMPAPADEQPPSPSRSGLWLAMNRLLMLGSVGILGLFGFSLLGRYFFLAELIGNFRCQILVMLVVAGMCMMLVRRWRLSGLLAIAAIWGMSGVVSVYLPAAQPDSHSASLKIMSFNVALFNDQFDDVLDQVRLEDPDLLTILEYTNRWDEVMPDRLENYPYRIREPRWHGLGIALFSKYPIVDPQVIPMTRQLPDNPWILAQVDFKDQVIQVAGVHVISPMNRERLGLRNQQFKEIAQRLSESNRPTVVMGDFNCTPWSPFLVDFLATTGYRDSRQGFGYQASWHTSCWPAGIPIDHAFVSPDIHVHDRRVGRYAGSDHWPIIFEVSVGGEGVGE